MNSPKNRLINTTETIIRFSEVDSMQIVWHGNYVKYLEDGREAFGREFNLGYYDVYNLGFMIPIVSFNISYKRMTKYGESITIVTEFVNTDAAKIVFDYKIYRSSDNALVLTAKTTQAFLDTNNELQLTNPQFYIDWKKKWQII